MIRLHHITKSFKDTIALEDISLEIAEGQLFGLIGPDGAGKTTLFRILTTLLLPDKGSATIGDWDIRKDYKKIRRHVGYMPGRFSLYQDLTVEENLAFFATIFGTTIRENYELIKNIYMQLEPFQARRAGALSGGMKQKLALCCALVHHPQVLLLDEPTTGVDPVSRKEFWDILGNLKQSGITILVSTPFMDEASRCERIALMQKGRMLAMDTPENIRSSFSKPLWSVRSDAGMYQLLHDVHLYGRTRSAFSFGDRVHYTDRQESKIAESLQEYLKQKGHVHIAIEPIPAGIEDRFMELMTLQEDVE